MRVTRDQAVANRERVVETGARLFREHGINGIGLADLMNAAGLTHGAFYKQFASKDALVAEACTAPSSIRVRAGQERTRARLARARLRQCMARSPSG